MTLLLTGPGYSVEKRELGPEFSSFKAANTQTLNILQAVVAVSVVAAFPIHPELHNT